MGQTTNRLRAARLEARLSLRDIAERTRLSPTMLRHIDEGRFDRLPAGLYARAWVRSYAEAVGLDADEVLRAVHDRLPSLGEWPHDDRAEAAPNGPGRTSTRAEALPQRPKSPPSVRPMRLVMAGAAPPLRRMQAAAVDTVVLAIVCAALASLTFGPEAASSATLPEFAGLAFTVLVIAVAYFTIFAGIGSGTPGMHAAGLAEGVEPEGPLTPTDIRRRAWTAFHAEASVLLDLALDAERSGLRRRELGSG